MEDNAKDELHFSQAPIVPLTLQILARRALGMTFAEPLIKVIQREDGKSSMFKEIFKIIIIESLVDI